MSIKTGKCVIVHTIAPGKSIQSYDDIARLELDFHPDFLMFMLNPSTMLYLTPTMQRHFFGYKEGSSPVAAMDFDEQRRLIYLPPDPNWFDNTLEPKPVLDSGTALSYAYLLPKEDAPPEVNRAWDVLSAIVQQYRKEFPETLIVFDGWFTGTRCVSLPDGCGPRPMPSANKDHGIVDGGPYSVARRLIEVCSKTGAICSVGDGQDLDGVFATSYNYDNDSHYTRFGNYWVAQRLGEDIFSELMEKMRSQDERSKRGE